MMDEREISWPQARPEPDEEPSEPWARDDDSERGRDDADAQVDPES